MKTFTEITEKKLSKLFMEFNGSPALAAYITNGFPIAVSSYLKKKLSETKSEYADCEIGGQSMGEFMKFTLKTVKKGDSVAFVPEFEIGTAGRDFINLDEIEFDEENITKMANDMINGDKDLVIAFKEAFAGKRFTDDGWVDTDSSDDEKGISFDAEVDIAMAACTTVAAIFEVLCNNKDSSSDIEYEVTGLGKFKVSPIKDGYNITLAFDKEFKSNCKSDKLAETLANE